MYSPCCTFQGMRTAATKLDAMGRVGKALADPTRCRILLALLDGPAYPAEIAARLGLTRANTSNHLGCLRGCGLLVTTAEGRRVRYELADPKLVHALNDLLEVVLAVDSEHCVHDEPAADTALDCPAEVPA